MNRFHRVWFTALALSACLDETAAPEEVEDLEELAVSDDTVFHEISITARPDGTFDVSEPRPITAGEQRAQNEWKAAYARGERPPLTFVDSSCGWSSFWLYDRTDWTGNRICFAGVGASLLAAYARYIPFVLQPSTWEIPKGSYLSGAWAGSLRGPGVSRETCGGPFEISCKFDEVACNGRGTCAVIFRSYDSGRFDLTAPLDTHDHY